MTTLLRGLDAATILTPHAKQIKAAGFDYVGRYLKSLSIAEVAALHAVGLGVWLIFESTATRSLAGGSAGNDDGVKASAQAKALGAPAGTVIYWTVDTDVLPSQLPAVGAYGMKFGAAVAAEGYGAGSYACGDALTYLAKNLALPPLPWLTGAMGWAGSRAYDATNAWVLKQGPDLGGRAASWAGLSWPALGFDYDPNVISRPDFGAWLPGDAVQQPASAPPATPVRAAVESPVVIAIKGLQSALKDAGLYTGEVDGIWGPRSDAALSSFSAH